MTIITNSNADWYNSIPVSGNTTQQPKSFLPSPQFQPTHHMHNTLGTPMNQSHYSLTSEITATETFDSASQLTNTFTTDDLQALKRIAFQLLLGLLKLQQEGIIHGDIKPENCFITHSTHDKDPTIFKLCDDDNSSIYSISSFTNSNPLIDLKKGSKTMVKIGSLANRNSTVVLGDFGSSFHSQSELSAHFAQFDVQSMPYRAPEVLAGIPFTNSIDIWSLGVLLMELSLQHLWFICSTRKEAMILISRFIQPFEKSAFVGGKYVDVLNEVDREFGWNSNDDIVRLAETESRLAVMKSLRAILQKRYLHITIPSYAYSEWIDFMSGLMQVNPSYRFSVQDALHHRIFSSTDYTLYSVPPSLAAHFYSLQQHEKKSVRTLNQVQRFRRQLASHVESAAMKRKLWRKQRKAAAMMMSAVKDTSILENKNGYGSDLKYPNVVEGEHATKRSKGNDEQMVIPSSSSSNSNHINTPVDLASSIPIAPRPQKPIQTLPPAPVTPIAEAIPVTITTQHTTPQNEATPTTTNTITNDSSSSNTSVPASNRRQARKNALNSLPQSALFPT
jgi:serine/threonine protein kinase